ncbi:MAG TPA: hypothetical protein VE053_03025 [Allosphingosinicella sp.]|nr:hypothetical protein [Allosphingosinicella sp.]
MTFKLMIALAALGSAALAGPAAAQQRPNEARDIMRSMGMKGLSPKKLAKAIEKAERSPLGSKANPVRENMPEGELDYLRRLRCADGSTPAADRKGNVGTGVYGNIIDHYAVTCTGAAAVDVYMDMYHDGPENRPLPGFTIVPAEGGSSTA